VIINFQKTLLVEKNIMSPFDDVKKCRINGKEIAYHRSGSGEPVLLVHGITTHSFIWRSVAELLLSEFDVIVPDLLGCGASDKPLDIEYSLINHAEMLKRVLEKLEIRKIHFVGHDVGGGIGQIFAVRYLDSLYDLSLVNTVAYDFWPVQPIITMRTPFLRQLAMATLDFGSFKLILRRAFYHKEKLTPELFAHFTQQLQSSEGRKAFLHFAKCLNNQHLLDIADELRRLSLPVLIVRGAADVYLKEVISTKLHREIPDSNLRILETAGHFIQEDEPQQLSDILTKFFTARSNLA